MHRLLRPDEGRRLRPSERVKLIQQVSGRLHDLEWGELDLTLRQFGLPWSPQWNDGDKRDYCIQHVEQGGDKELLDLYEHLHGAKFELVPQGDGAHLWQEGCFRLFLTHISSAKKFVSAVKANLSPYAIDAFVAHEDIEPTREWEQEIEAALDTCDALVAFLTPDFHDSLWTDQEVGYCVRRRVLIIPVRMGMDPYGFLGRYQALSPGDRDAAWVSGALFEIMLDHDLTADRMAPAVVRMFEYSGSFASAKANLQFVKRVRRWSPELLRRLEASIEANDQIEHAWGVADEVRQLVKRHSRQR